MVRKKKKRTKTTSRPRLRRESKKIKRAKPEKIKKINICVVGIGGGGGSIVSEIARIVKGASFFAANTDKKALRGLSRDVSKFQFGQDLTYGLGTGMNPEIGEEAAKNEKEKIKEMLEGKDFVILISCLGGGVGSGATPIFASISKKLGNLTYGIFTLPFKFEGEKKMDIAKGALRKLRGRVSAFSVIPNERIFQIIDRNTPLKKALSSINKNLIDSIQSLIEIIYKPGLINIDFADLRTIFEGSGKLTYLNSIEIERGGAKEEIEKVTGSPLHPYGIRGARGVLFNISGQKNLSLDQVSQISKAISNLAHKEAKIIFGISKSKKDSKIRVSLLATGCGGKIFPRRSKVRKPKKRKRKKKVNPKPRPKVKKRPKKPKKRTKKIRKRAKLKKKLRPKKIKIKVKPSSKPTSSKRSKPRKKRGGKKEKIEVKVRKNAIQVQKEIEAEEAEIIAKEKFWETPTFLRKRLTQEH